VIGRITHDRGFEMPSIKAVLIDLDGTLVDSAFDLQSSLNMVLRKEGLRELGIGEVKSMIGDGVAKLVERAWRATGGDMRLLPDAQSRFLDHYERNAATATQAYPGVAQTLEVLHRAGLCLACVTNKPVAPAGDILRALGLGPYFGAIVGGDTLPVRKPDPGPLLHALAMLGSTAGEAVMVGDNYHDVVAARAAGLRSVAVTYGYSHKAHAELGADALIDAFDDLPAALQRLQDGCAPGPRSEPLGPS
jgi:phosphoglycolate phosphatase